MKDAETGGSVLRASIKWKTEVLQVNGISVHVEPAVQCSFMRGLDRQ